MQFRTGIPSDTQFKTYKLLLNVCLGSPKWCIMKNFFIYYCMKSHQLWWIFQSMLHHFLARKLYLYSAHCHLIIQTQICFQKFSSGLISRLQTSMQWMQGHIGFHNIQPIMILRIFILYHEISDYSTAITHGYKLLIIQSSKISIFM